MSSIVDDYYPWLTAFYVYIIAYPGPFSTVEKNDALNTELFKALENTKVNRRQPAILPTNPQVESACKDASTGNSNRTLDIADSLQRNKKRSFRTLLRLGSSNTATADTGLSEAMQYLLSLGLVSPPPTIREECRQSRQKKLEKMRLQHKMSPEVAAKYRALRLDRPDPEFPSISIQEWNGQQVAVFQAELDMQRHEQELDEKYCLRVKSQPEQEKRPVIKLTKSCLKTGERKKTGKKTGKKSVRFDDVHVGKKVKWVDGEHVAELEKPDVYFVDYGCCID